MESECDVQWYGIVFIVGAYSVFKRVILIQREKITLQILALSEELSGV